MNRYSSWGNDDFASILFLICIIEAYKLYNNFNIKDFSILILLCIFTFLIKTFFIISLLIPFYLFLKNIKNLKFHKFLNTINFFTFFFIFFWLSKNFLNSSCILFPLEFTCVLSFDWSLTKIAINNISQISEAWSKDFPNYALKNLNFKEYNANFNWIPTWLDNHFRIILKNILVLIPIILLLNTFNKIELNKIQKKFIVEFLFLSIVFTLVWFFKFPLLRFGEGFLVTMITLFLLILNFNRINFTNIKNFKIMFIFILIMAVLLKNSLRIYYNFENKYVGYPWQKK